jgi:hypothetical protein
MILWQMISIEQFWNNLLLLQIIKLMTKFDIDLLAHLAITWHWSIVHRRLSHLNLLLWNHWTMSSLTYITGFSVKFFFQPIYTDYANYAYFDKRSYLNLWNIWTKLTIKPQVIKFTSCLPMVGGSLRVLWLLPPLKLVTII